MFRRLYPRAARKEALAECCHSRRRRAVRTTEEVPRPVRPLSLRLAAELVVCGASTAEYRHGPQDGDSIEFRRFCRTSCLSRYCPSGADSRHRLRKLAASVSQHFHEPTPHSRPIAAASAANASSFLQVAVSKAIRRRDLDMLPQTVSPGRFRYSSTTSEQLKHPPPHRMEVA